MKDQFYMVLPSNSSMLYYPNNTTAHFITQLPQQINLCGSWSVALTGLQIPLTFQHLPLKKEEERRIVINTAPIPSTQTNELRPFVIKQKSSSSSTSVVRPGVYENLGSLIEEINNLSPIRGHLEFNTERGGYTSIRRICTDCKEVNHSIQLSASLSKILGFQSRATINIDNKIPCTGIRPANLSSSLPDILMVYCDLCEPYITGDVQTKLLRTLAIEVNNYSYGCLISRSFDQPIYLPLLFNTFHTVEINIRDAQGVPLSFDFGTATAILHFKRTD